MPNYLPLEVQTKKIKDSRINGKKNKTRSVAWPRCSSATPRYRGSPRRSSAMPRHNRNFSEGVSGSPRHTPRRAHLRLGVGVSSRKHKWPVLAIFTGNLLTKSNHFKTKLQN